MPRALAPTRNLAIPALLALGVGLGCTGVVNNDNTNPNPQLPGGGTAGNGGGTGGSSGTMMPGPTGTDCVVQGYPASKRIVRLSFNQIANSIGSIVDPAFATKVVSDFELVDAQHRAFPPLQSPREGNSLTDQSWGTIDQIASAAGKHVVANFAMLTGCAEATDACAQQYLNNLAQKAYRRPLTADEQTRLTTLYTTALRGTAMATVNEAVQHVVYAILQSPQFLYRTEFGSDWQVDGLLSPYEVASMLSFFLTDNAPDTMLLEAAAQNKLTNAAEITPHVERILATDAAKRNLEGAMMSYFAYPNLETQVIQDAAFTGDMRTSMYREAEMFMNQALWSGTLNEMLISRRGFVNMTLAPIYGVAFPPPGVTPDANGFAQIELPANRTGLLTQAAFLANRSRPDHTSVVGRGLLVKQALLCTDTPAPPDNLAETIAMVTTANPDATERELSNLRNTTNPCSGCHLTFDAYGLALDTFDVLGRYREQDSHGKPIDPSVTLPLQVGGGSAKDIVEVAQKLAESGAFAKCMGRNLVNYALADVSAGSAAIDSCAVSNIAKSFATTDRSFSALVKAVATSEAFAGRSKGAAQ